MERLTITKVYRSNKDKSGNPLRTSDGREYTRLAIKTKEHGDKWLSGFGNESNASWKVGDEIEVIVEQKGEYLNFSMPKKTDALEARVEKLEIDLKAVMAFVFADKGQDLPPEEPQPEETPF